MKPLGFRALYKEANSADRTPKKPARKFKKKERQLAKKNIKKQLQK